ncbi:DNA ligase [Herbaspirillum sp. LeCh32-8]|uniref:DNA ligase n=1 Tax=Herbaspirillum sp. LeCh32-8 TaxID=2821356 RepID=UPI001AEA35A7|nr:DNA ligase [Herbaspirillum sp. LeCh32-8]MBP0600123.1 DNA ligase [Herbaspirillum sp. LeCh32-8]
MYLRRAPRRLTGQPTYPEHPHQSSSRLSRRLFRLLSPSPSLASALAGEPARRLWLRRLPALLALGVEGAPSAWASGRPPLMLAGLYREGIALIDFWVSEKYDGIRAYWDGRRLYRRGGETIQAPSWFTQDWPARPLDGELWGGRGQFEATLSTVRRQVQDEQAWHDISFMAFDMPAEQGSFDQRLLRLQALVETIGQPWVVAVRQRKVSNHQALQRLLEDVERRGGEGLVLHRGASSYSVGRSDDLLKLKSHLDAEARVIEYLAGKGKYQGMVGALVLETPQGLRFHIGSGLSDAQRRDPPPLGSVVTYRYRGLHVGGRPRFAVLLRERSE